MNKITLAIALAGALVLPATAAAKPPAEQEQQQAAHAQCKAERGKSNATREAFKAKYHIMSRCVRKHAAEEAAEDAAARKNASKECKAEASDPNFEATNRASRSPSTTERTATTRTPTASVCLPRRRS